MNKNYQPIHGQAPDRMECYWLTVSLPDGLYVLPPDAATQQVAGDEHATETLLVGGVLFAVGLLVTLLALLVVIA